MSSFKEGLPKLAENPFVIGPKKTAWEAHLKRIGLAENL